MQKNWYAVYTKPYCEKKVSQLLSRKRFENFCPLNYKLSHSLLRKKTLHEPLFKGYVFVKATDSDIATLKKQVKGILSVLYWMGKPAIINENEIDAIKEFSVIHKEIKLEKFHVNMKSDENAIDEISYKIEGKILMIKNRVIKINLPSLGYTMIAKAANETIMGREASFMNSQKFLLKS